MMGAGKYDDEATRVRGETNAAGVLVIVFGGSRGSGFSAQLSAPLLAAVPAILRNVADEIERSHEGRPS